MEININGDNPFDFFDQIYCINLDRDKQRWQSAHAQYEALGIAGRVQKFSAIETPDNHHIGCALSHRAIVQNAKNKTLKNVLVLEDDAIFRTDTLAHLGRSLKELCKKDWHLLYLGGHCWNIDYQFSEACKYLREIGLREDEPHGPSCTQAIVYHSSCFDYVLGSLPATIALMEQHLKYNMPAIDQQFAVDQRLKRFITHPRLASQPPLLKQETKDFVPIYSNLD